MPSRLHGWRAGLLLAMSATAIALAALAAAGEWAVRHRERTRETVPGTMSKLFYRHARLMHGLERGADYYGWVHIGRQGFRGARDVVEGRRDSVFRIIAVGGSTTFDANTSGDSSAWPARLEQVLDSVAAPARFEVLNAGVPGFQVFDDLVRLQLELHRYAPDLIILYQGHNDLFNTLARAGRVSGPAFDPRPGEIPAIAPWQLWLERHSLLYHKLRSRWQAIRYRSRGARQGARSEPADYQRVLDAGLADYARNVRAFLAVAQSFGATVIVARVVYGAETAADAGADSTIRFLWQRTIPFAPPEIVWNGYARFDSAAQAAAASYGVAYVPASDRLLWRLDGYTEGDPVHFNDAGAWRLARHLAEAIRSLPVVEQARMAATERRASPELHAGRKAP